MTCFRISLDSRVHNINIYTSLIRLGLLESEFTSDDILPRRSIVSYGIRFVVVVVIVVVVVVVVVVVGVVVVVIVVVVVVLVVVFVVVVVVVVVVGVTVYQ